MRLESVQALKSELAVELGMSAGLRSLSSTSKGTAEEFAFGRMTHGGGLDEPHLPPPPAIALGIAPGRRDGYSLAVRVQLKSHLRSPVVADIRRRAEGEVDIRYIGSPVPAGLDGWHRSRCAPLRLGTSIGSRTQGTTGTLGGFVEPKDGGSPHILSNAHILAGWNKGKSGDEILQPGWDDKGKTYPPVAALAGFVPLRRGRSNTFDCATAELLGDAELSDPPSLLLGDANVKQPVAKDGRTTGRTTGHVTAIDLGVVKMRYPRPLGKLGFSGLIEVEGEGSEPFAAHGDSGALVISGDRDAIGLLFAVSGKGGQNGRGTAFLTPLSSTLDRLGMRLVP